MIAEVNGNELKLYGLIWGGDGAYISRDIESFLKSQSGDVTVRLHTPGGSVIDGNLIFNTLSKANQNVHVIIDGLAASMGTIIMLAGNRLSIAENAYIMIHAPSGSAVGNKNDFESVAKLLGNIEKNFINKYKNKTGLDEDTIKSWLVGDNWFSAEEAKEAGLVDDIVDASIASDQLDFEAYGDYSIAAVSHVFKDFNSKHQVETPKPNSKTNKKIETMQKLSSNALAALNIEANATDEELSAAVIALSDQKKQLKSDLKSQKDAEIKSLLDQATSEGKIVASERSDFEALAEKDFEMCKKAIAKIPSKQSITASIKEEDTKNQLDARKDWDFDKWRKQDPQGLIQMKEENPDAYKALLGK